MRTEKITALTLKYSVLAGMVLAIIGEAVKLAGSGDLILRFGILFLILSPLFAIVAATVSFVTNGERKWTVVAIALIAVLSAGMLVTFFTI